jgi:hypothetical protein
MNALQAPKTMREWVRLSLMRPQFAAEAMRARKFSSATAWQMAWLSLLLWLLVNFATPSPQQDAVILFLINISEYAAVLQAAQDANMSAQLIGEAFAKLPPLSTLQKLISYTILFGLQFSVLLYICGRVARRYKGQGSQDDVFLLVSWWWLLSTFMFLAIIPLIYILPSQIKSIILIVNFVILIFQAYILGVFMKAVHKFKDLTLIILGGALLYFALTTAAVFLVVLVVANLV